MMHDPSHPGEVIKHDCIEASQLTVTDAADGLGVSRKALSELINCKSGVSPDMAMIGRFGSSSRIASVWPPLSTMMGQNLNR